MSAVGADAAIFDWLSAESEVSCPIPVLGTSGPGRIDSNVAEDHAGLRTALELFSDFTMIWSF